MRAFFAISLASLLLAVLTGCGGSSSTTDQTVASAETGNEAATAETSNGGATALASAAEIFISDEGAGCAVYVSVDESAVSDETDARSLVWQGLIDNDFPGCDFSDVVEVGLITVRDLDEYNQPDWSTVLEHQFFGVEGWPELMESCLKAPLPAECDDLLQSGIVDR